VNEPKAVFLLFFPLQIGSVCTTEQQTATQIRYNFSA